MPDAPVVAGVVSASETPDISPARVSRRIAVIDAQRGLAIVFMAIVHCGFFAKASVMAEYYIDRHSAIWGWPWWAIGVLCNASAPSFWLLSGVSLRLLAERNLRRFGTEDATWRFLLVRVALFFALDATLIPWFWQPLRGFHFTYEFELLSSLGVSMLLLGIVRMLPDRVLGVLTAALLLGYPALIHAISPDLRATGPVLLKPLLFYDFAHSPTVAFPVLGWCGLMMLGWVLAPRFREPLFQRPRTWFLIGLALHAVWITIRVTRGYGGFMPWPQGSGVREFFILCEGPPGIDYFALNLADAAWLFGLLWAAQKQLSRVPLRWLVTLGQASFFSYLIHLPLYKFLARIGLKVLPHATAPRFALTTLAGLAIMIPAAAWWRRVKQRYPDGIPHYL
jgi:uncharacterized membrane protein